MWIQAIFESVFTYVSHGVRQGGGTQQSDPHHVVVNIMSIFAVVQEADAIVSFAQIHPLMGAGLEARPIPACIAMSGALYIAPLNFICCLWGKQIHREGDLE